MAYLPSPRLGMILLDLNFNNVAWVLNDLTDESFVFSSDFTHGSFRQVNEATNHPKLPENTDSIAERLTVWLDHAECAMERPKEEEHKEEMVSVPINIVSI